jgi:tetratricopeptide (TPR) repeat protein
MTLCGDEEMRQLLGAIHAGTNDELPLAERLLDSWPEDPRLHFLRGSLLAGAGRPIEAHAALSRAVALQPEFHLARFQLGFFELTSGEAARAVATWEPLDALPADHYLAHFVTGLRYLIQDRFGEAMAALEAGIAANDENPPLNHDMQLIVTECAGLAGSSAEPESAASATSLLLDQFGRGTRH